MMDCLLLYTVVALALVLILGLSVYLCSVDVLNAKIVLILYTLSLFIVLYLGVSYVKFETDVSNLSSFVKEKGVYLIENIDKDKVEEHYIAKTLRAMINNGSGHSLKGKDLNIKIVDIADDLKCMQISLKDKDGFLKIDNRYYIEYKVVKNDKPKYYEVVGISKK